MDSAQRKGHGYQSFFLQSYCRNDLGYSSSQPGETGCGGNCDNQGYLRNSLRSGYFLIPGNKNHCAHENSEGSGFYGNHEMADVDLHLGKVAVEGRADWMKF